ncbi:MAG: gliding motility-associated-like protein/CSLREA domain-containing protein [Paraglaciecola sp.]|jgi:gliding motility-associated-like protein/CSLREA domain-containing protein
MSKLKTAFQLMLCFLLFANLAQAATFTVTSLDNTDDGTCDTGHCSLHEAIDAANLAGGADNIVFSVAGSIVLSGGIGDLPDITGVITIDGGGMVTLIGAGSAGLRLVAGSANSTVQNLTIENCAGGGISIDSAPGVTISGCTMNANGVSAGSSSNGNGLNFTSSDNCVISGNTIISNQESGVFFFNCNMLSFSTNFMQTNGFHGVVGIDSDNVTFDGNNSSNNGFNQPSAAGDPSSSGFILVNSSNNTITNNTLTGSVAEAGVLLVNTTASTITGNMISNNFKAGIWLILSDDNSVTGNTIFSNTGSSTSGVLLEGGSDNNDIKNNALTANQKSGVEVSGGSGNEITENMMMDNGDIGITLSGGNNNASLPVVTGFSFSEMTGTVGSNSMIHVYEADPDSPCQGMTFIGSFGPFSGAWTINGTFDALVDHAITGTLIGASTSTSEFVCFGAICDDGCALTTDFFNTATGQCEFTPPSCDDNCPLTTDSFNDMTCECENIEPDCDDGCPLTTDNWNIITCQCENVEPSCADNCPQTIDFYDELNCQCQNIEPDCEDGCPDTFDSFNNLTCQCESVEPNCSDQCPQTIDFYNINTCECENIEPDCDDGCALTVDAWNNMTCGCDNIEPVCDDGCIVTTDTFNDNTCECESTEPSCDDGCALTVDSWNAATCMCENVEPDCNDGCVATMDSFNTTTCECENIEPDCDDLCELTIDSWNAVDCQCENVEPDCNDNCGATTDSYDAANCECINDAPNCDDGCELTTDTWDAANCQCENIEPNPDDGCALTVDSYDAANCIIINEQPDCDDMDCATTDSYDAANCACINDPIAPPPAMDASATLCEEMNGMVTFNLLELDVVVNMGSGNTVTWMDADGQIANPSTYETGTTTVTAEISDNETPVCQTSTATVILTVQTQATAEVTLTATVCNTSAGGSILNLNALITGGDMTGMWMDMDGAGVDLMNTMSVDFDGVDSDNSPYTLLYTTNSAAAPCQESTYPVEVFVENCACPSVATNAPTAVLCNDAGTLDLTTLEITTESGTWTITSPMGNPPSIMGNVFDATGAPAGDYEITFTLDTEPPANCQNSSTQTISIVNQPNAGMDTQGDYCNDEIDLIVLAELLMNEDANGTWGVSATSPDIPQGGAFDFENGTFNPAGHPAGIFVFSYTLGGSTCMDAISNVTINLLAADMVFLQGFTCEMSEVGIDTLALNNQFGCDSLVITTTDLLMGDTTNLTEFTCNPDNEGMSEVLLENQNGCDSLLIINTIFDASAIDSTFVPAFTCDEMMVGTVENTLAGSDGCDSIVFTVTELLVSDTTNLMEFTCNPANEGMSEVLLENQAGCDSLLIINTIFDAAAIDSTFVQEFTCDETMVGTIENTLMGSDGCDSLVFVSTDLLASDTTNLMEFTCNPDGEGMSEVLLQNEAGCDSLLIVNTIFDANAIDTTFAQAFTCYETMVGTIENTLMGSDGCDSIVFVTTDLLASDTTNLMEFTCNPDDEGMSEVLLQNQAGCDSLLIINTIFDANAIDTTYLNTTTCDPTMVGTDENLLVGSDGCDSLVITETMMGNVPEAFISPADNLDCNQTTVLLTGDDLVATNPTTSEWQDATGNVLSNEAMVEVTTVGIYTYIITDSNSGCTDSETVEVLDLIDNPTADAGLDVVLDCSGNSTILNADASQPAGDLTFEWFDSSGTLINMNNEASVETTEEGTYLLTVINTTNGCSASDEVVVTPFEIITAEADEFSIEINTEISDDLLINDNLNGQNVLAAIENSPESGMLTVNSDGTFTFIPEINFIGTVTFDYSICIENCLDICSTNTVAIEVIGEAFSVPNAFSPNDDGKNDTWVIPGIEQFPSSHLRVVNRWGDILFEIRRYQNDWAGVTNKGDELPSGTYYYLLVLDLASEQTYEGTITIVR